MIPDRLRMCVLACLLSMQGVSAKAETFTFGIGEWPPFISLDAAGYGDHARQVTEAFKKAGHDVRFEFLPWRRSLEMTRHGKLPATFSWAFAEERTADFLYPQTPIDLARDVYFYRKDRFPDGLEPLSFAELKRDGLTVVGVTDYWYQRPLEKAGVHFQKVSTEEQAWSMMLHRRADLYIENEAVGTVQSRDFLGDQAKLFASSRPLRIVPLYVLFSRAHPDGKRMKDIWDTYGGREQLTATKCAVPQVALAYRGLKPQCSAGPDTAR